MEDLYRTLSATIMIGAGATLIMDIWAIVQKRVWGIPSLNYDMVGRWIGHLPSGRFSHNPIGTSAPIRFERVIGWGAHYLIGIAFAGILIMVVGGDWVMNPTLGPALGMGLITLIAPFLILQPGLGAGIAASRTPNPNLARFRSLVAHMSFGIGLYIAAKLVAFAL